MLHFRGHFLSPASRTDARIFDESLVVVYRILFLLFAEARGLVPCWHPTYRNAYTIEALRPSIEQTARPRGLWESLQAIARLAHDGCRAGSLRVPPFNGRLFSPTHAPLADRMTLDDAAVRRALLALTTRRGRAGIERVAYGDLGVEQLGGVYERILDFEPSPGTRTGPTLVRGLAGEVIAPKEDKAGTFVLEAAYTDAGRAPAGSLSG